MKSVQPSDIHVFSFYILFEFNSTQKCHHMNIIQLSHMETPTSREFFTLSLTSGRFENIM